MPMIRKGNDDCLYPDCTEKELIRGLCKRHYNVAYILIKSEYTTWEALTEKGCAKIVMKKSGGKINEEAIKWFLK